MAIEQHVNGKVSTFLLLSRDQLKNGCDQYIMSIVRAVGRHWKIQVQIRTKTSSTAWGWKKCFHSSCCYSDCFFVVLTLSKTTPWSKQMWLCYMFLWIQMQCRASAVEMKIERIISETSAWNYTMCAGLLSKLNVFLHKDVPPSICRVQC